MTSLVDKAIDQLFLMNDVMIIEKSPLGERIPFPVNIDPSLFQQNALFVAASCYSMPVRHASKMITAK